MFSALNFKGHGIGIGMTDDGGMDMAALPYPKRQEDSKPAWKSSETCSDNALFFWLYDLILQGSSFRTLLQNGHEPMTKGRAKRFVTPKKPEKEEKFLN